MEKLQFGDSEERYPIKSIKPSAVHIMQIIYAETMPDESVYKESITIYSNGDIKESTLTGWNTIYKIEEENLTIYLSDDESVYIEPVAPDPDDTDPDYTEPEPYEPTLEEVQAYKVSEIQSACANTIRAGVDVEGEHFSLTTEAQLSLMVKQHKIDTGETEIDFYPDGEASKYYTAEEMQNIINIATDFIDYHQVYCNELVLWIMSLTDKDEIEEIYYGIEIPQDHRSTVLEDMLPTADDETGMIPQEGDDNDDEPNNEDNDDTTIGGSFNDDNSEEVGDN